MKGITFLFILLSSYLFLISLLFLIDYNSYKLYQKEILMILGVFMIFLVIEGAIYNYDYKNNNIFRQILNIFCCPYYQFYVLIDEL